MKTHAVPDRRGMNGAAGAGLRLSCSLFVVVLVAAPCAFAQSTGTAFERPQQAASSRPFADGPGARSVGFRQDNEEAAAPEAQRRRTGTALAEVVGVNAFYWLVSRSFPWKYQDHFRVSPATWWTNLRSGFTWDRDPFFINQFGHPYQGNNYFTAGRALGFSYWEATALTTVGSLTWEMFGERTQPAWNDLVNSTLGGSAIGEVTHRLAAAVRGRRRTTAPGRLRKVAAFVVNPVGAVNRFGPSLPQAPDTVAGEIAVGTLWRAARGTPTLGRPSLFGTVRVEYGRLEDAPAGAPFDAFTFALGMDGQSGLAHGSIRGRLAARRVGTREGAPHQVVLVQGYDYQDNRLLRSGGQSVLGGLANRFRLSSSTTLTTCALAGPIVLGVIGSSTDAAGERPYDYGSGLAASLSAELSWRDHRLVRLAASRSFLRTFTGTSSTHVLGRYSIAARVPLARGAHVVLEGDRFGRTWTGPGVRERADGYHELRAGLAWAFGRQGMR